MWGRLARSAMSGTAITVGSLTVPCVLAVYVEKAANRALFTLAPEKFAKVDHALGVEDSELTAVREATYASEFLPVTLHHEQEKEAAEKVLAEGDEWEQQAAQEQTAAAVTPSIGIRLSEKHVFSCALTS